MTTRNLNYYLFVSERRKNTKKLNVCFINMDMSVVPTSYIVSCHAWFKTCDIYAQTMLTQYLQISKTLATFIYMEEVYTALL